jgi:hypothetical protein
MRHDVFLVLAVLLTAQASFAQGIYRLKKQRKLADHSAKSGFGC